MKFRVSLFVFFIWSFTFTQVENFPIQLSMPFDEDTITNTVPNFIWQCDLASIQTNPRLSLQYVLVEKFDSQTKTESLTTNTPINVVSNLLSTSYNHPSTLEELKPGHSYVWQVQLLFNDVVVQVSEPWVFTIFKPFVPKVNYTLLRKKLDGSIYYTNMDKLYVMIPNDYQVENLTVIIRDNQNVKREVELIQVENEGSTSKKNYSNLYFELDLSDLNLNKGYYTMDWISGKKQHYFLNFQLD